MLGLVGEGLGRVVWCGSGFIDWVVVFRFFLVLGLGLEEGVKLKELV